MKTTCLLIALMCSMLFVACDNDPDDNSDSSSPSNGFTTEVGISYAIIETTTDNLKRLYLKYMGAGDVSNADLSAFGLDEDTFAGVLPDLISISYSPNEGFSEPMKCSGSKNGNLISYELSLNAETTYYYKINYRGIDGSFQTDGQIYSLRTKGISRSDISISVGDAKMSFSGFTKILFDDNSVQVKGVNAKEKIWCGIVFFPESEKSYLTEDQMDFVWYNKESNTIVDFLPFEYNGLTPYAKSRGFSEVTYLGNEVTAKFSPNQTLSQNRKRGWYYYSVVVLIGGKYFLGEIKSVNTSAY